MQPDQNPNNQYPQTQPGTDRGLSPAYDFIVNPAPPPKKTLNFGIKNPMISRLVIVLGGLLILVIIFAVVKNLLTTKPFITADYVSVMQQQEEILHILSADLITQAEQSQLTSSNENFVMTTQLVIGSGQNQMMTYLKANHVTVKPTELSLKINTTTDTELSNSLETNNFSQEFVSIMQQELQTYQRNLSVAYNSSHGTKGRALLKSEYAGAVLLIKQLNLPSS